MTKVRAGRNVTKTANCRIKSRNKSEKKEKIHTKFKDPDEVVMPNPEYMSHHEQPD